MRTSIDLPADLYHRLRESAARQGISFSEFVVSCLEKEAPELVTSTRERPSRAVIPGLSSEQAVKLFGNEAATVYLAARQRIREKGYPDNG